jgi:hypothetical protein
VAKVRERLVVSKQIMLRFHMERFNLMKLNEVGGKEQHPADVTNKFTAFKNLNIEVDINDHLCGLVIRVLGYRSGGPCLIPSTTRKKKE